MLCFVDVLLLGTTFSGGITSISDSELKLGFEFEFHLKQRLD